MAYRGGFGFGSMLTPWVKRLLIANLAIFLISPWIGEHLVLDTRAMFLRPWSIVTYMFVHGGFWHIFGNMLGLFFFGPPLESRIGSNSFIRFYLACGISGGLLFFLTSLFSGPAQVVGASGAVIGVMVAFALYWPDATIWLWFAIPVPAKFYIAFLVIGDLYLAIQSSPGDPVAHFAHLGGVVAAFLYVKWWQPRHLNEWKARASGPSTKKSGGLFGALRGGRKREFTIAPGGAGRPAERPQPRPRRQDEERVLDEVDRVLDKISKQGIASLSPEERKLLDDVSRRYRSN